MLEDTRAILITHAEIFIEDRIGNPGHIVIGRDKITKIVSRVISLIDQDKKGGGLSVLVMGVGDKYEESGHEVMRQTANKYPGVEPFFSLFAGCAISMRSREGIAISTMGSIYKATNTHVMTEFVTPNRAWQYVRKMIRIANKLSPNSYMVVSGGRQCMKVLGVNDKFKIASAWELDWRNQEINYITDSEESVELVARC